APDGKFSFSIVLNVQTPFTPLFHEAAEGDVVPRCAEHDPRNKTISPDKQNNCVKRFIMIFINKYYRLEYIKVKINPKIIPYPHRYSNIRTHMCIQSAKMKIIYFSNKYLIF